MLLSIHLLNFFLRLGAPTATLTLVITIARSIDLLSDPALGWATDANIFRCCGPCRFPKGVRRKPFMLLGTPLYDIFLILLLGTPVDLEGNGWGELRVTSHAGLPWLRHCISRSTARNRVPHRCQLMRQLHGV